MFQTIENKFLKFKRTVEFRLFGLINVKGGPDKQISG